MSNQWALNKKECCQSIESMSVVQERMLPKYRINERCIRKNATKV